MKTLAESLASFEAKITAAAATWQACEGCGDRAAELIDGRCGRCEQEAARCRITAAVNRDSALRAIGVPERYRGRFEDRAWPVDADQRKLATHLWRGDPWSVTFVGAVGAGKTFFAVELAWRNFFDAPTKLAGSRFVLASEVPARWFDREDSGSREALISAPLLIIDDLGLGHQGGAWEAIDDLICRRYAVKAPTVVTTRWSLRQLAEEAGSSADRLKDGILAIVEGGSQRAPQRKRQ